MIVTKAYKTAIKRKDVSAPMRQLATDGLIINRALDYGCGWGCDAETYGMESYDPHYQPIMPMGLFKTITCNYVLNVIESNIERLKVLTDIQRRLELQGVAYITVRNDKRALNGITKIGTWQGLIMLSLPIRHKCFGYIIYELRRQNVLGSHHK